MTDTINLTLPGDAPYGFELSGLTFLNKAGHPVSPAPVADTVSVTSTDDIIVTGAYIGDGKVHIVTNDDAVPGAQARLTISADATGADDDAYVDVTIGVDRLSRVNLGNATITELTAPLSPPSQPDPVVPPADPVPTDPAADPA